MTLYNFSDINVVFDFEYKLKARIWNDDIEGVASMLTSAYNTVNPENIPHIDVGVYFPMR